MEEQLSMFQVGADGIIIPASAVTEQLRADSEVRASYDLLNGQFRMNYIEWRLFFAMLSCIDEEDTEFRDYYIRVQDIIDMAELRSGSHLYDEVRGAVKSLMGQVVEWLETTEELRYAQLVTDASYFPKQGIIKLRPHPKMERHLLRLRRNFTSAQLRQCIKFSSTYASRLYMLLKQFDSKKGGYRLMSIEELRFKLGLDYTDKIGKKEVKQSVYPRYTDIRRFVLEPAQNELATTDIPFDFIPIKTGRKVSAIKFVLKGGRKFIGKTAEQESAQLSEDQAAVWGALKGFRFTDHQVEQIIRRGTVSDIRQVIYDIRTTDKDAAGKPIQNKSAYAYGVFKKKFGFD